MLTAAALAVSLTLGVVQAPAKPRCRSGDGWLCVITAKGSSPGATGPGSGPDSGSGADGPSCGADTCLGWAPGPARLTTAQVVEMAKDAIALPPPRPHTNPARRTWVGIRTFLWIDRAQWRSRSARVSVGGQTVTITGRPSRVIWDLGETSLTCHGPGVPYSRGRTTYCAHTYRRSSAMRPRKAYDVRVTMQYDITWTCTGACDSPGGTIGPLPATTRTSLRVAEIQTTATHTG